MTGFKDIINFLFPTPPTVLIRENSFPDCPSIFVDISKNPKDPKKLGKRFSTLCRLSGFAWVFWIFNFIYFFSIFLIFILNWGSNTDMVQPVYFNHFSCKMIISILAALLFVFKIIFNGLNLISMQLRDECYSHISQSNMVQSGEMELAHIKEGQN